MPLVQPSLFHAGLVVAGLLLSHGLVRATLASKPVAPVSFRNEVQAVLAKGGCSSGACHGNKNGKGGFKLSLRGEDAVADHAMLTATLGARRLDLVEPEQSLLLLKPTSAVPHEGRHRFATGSPEYEILRRWIAGGARDDGTNAPALVKLEVSPREKILYPPINRVQVRTTAWFADGTRRDVTALAVYEAANTLVDISPAGLITAKGPGETTVLARFLGQQTPVTLAFVPKNPAFKQARPPEQNFVDRQIFAKLRTLRLNPSAVCADEVFLRRAYLDLLGLLPTAVEARAFVADASRDKRARLVDQLLARPEFDDFWTLKWADLLRADERPLDTKGVRAIHDWIRSSLATHKPLDQFARELIAARGSTYTEPAANYWRAQRTPVERAEGVAQVWLGTRLQCAQCHNHPYERWTQDDYHDWTGVFARVDYKIIENKRRDTNDSHEFIGEQIVLMEKTNSWTNPRTSQAAHPRLLGEGRALGVDEDYLTALASWLTKPENPLFARAQANRIWFHLMGRGLVDPVDDFRATNPASHPALLAALAAELVNSKFDLRQLIRVIMNSRAYQLASEPARGSEEDLANYSHNIVRRLTAEQLLDCQSEATGALLEFEGYPAGTRVAQLPGVRVDPGPRKRLGELDRYLRTFGRPPRQLPTECERSSEPAMSQAFQLISGPTVQQLLIDPENRLKSLLKSGRSHREIIDELWWAALTRAPNAVEQTRVLALLDAAPDPRAVLEDVMWSLLNAKEFVLRR